MALTMQDLDRVTCNCGHDECENNVLWFHSKCHPRAANEISYEKGSGYLIIRCNECKALVAEIAVATTN